MAASSASSVPPASAGSVITVASPSTGSPCAACKFLRRKCQPDCVFAPYFPPDNPQKFVHVHRVFGASNVSKILNELHPYQREDAVNSLAYEADMRLRDPVYGCVGVISILQHRLRQVQQELARASYELSKYQAAAEAAAASVAVGSNGGAAAGMADFVDNPGPNCTQNFINGHSTAAAAIGGAGFAHPNHFASVQMLARSYDGEAAAARLGMNGAGGGRQIGSPRRGRLVLAGCARAGESESKAVQLVLGGRARNDTDSESSDDEGGEDGEVHMTDEERRTLRRKIREMMDRVLETAELTDPEERRAKMRELLTKYELVVEEEDPDWPEDAEDGMGFSLGQFFDKITIKAEKKDDAEEEEEDTGHQSDKEIVWEDDNYIKPIRDVKTQDWDASVSTDFGPMVVLVHNRYKRPQENEMARAELTKAIEMFWEHNLSSPRCVAVDACAEPDLVDALKVSGFPEILFTNAGRIIHREKEAWSRMMAFFYYKAARPPFLCEADGKGQEKVPLMS